MLRHQLNVLRRRVPSKPKLAIADRLLFVLLYRLFPIVLSTGGRQRPAVVRVRHTDLLLHLAGEGSATTASVSLRSMCLKAAQNRLPFLTASVSRVTSLLDAFAGT